MSKNIFIIFCLIAGLYTLAKERIPNAVQLSQSAVFKVENNEGSVYGSGFFIANGKTFVTTFDLMYKLLNHKNSKGLDSILLIQGNKKFQVKSVTRILPLHNIVFLEIEAHNEHFLNFLHVSDRSTLYKHKGEAYTFKPSEDGLDVLEWTKLLKGSRHEVSFIGNHTQTTDSTGSPVLNRQGEMLGIHLSSFHMESQSIANTLKTAHLRDLLHQNPAFEDSRLSVAEQFERSLRHLESLTTRNAMAQLALANIFFEINNMEEALKWYLQAAKQGIAEAQYRAAIMYYRGIGIPEHKTLAFSWFRTAAKQGMVLAQYNLGIMYVSGDVVAQDKKEGLFWLLQAAVRGISLAQYHAASILYFGAENVHQDKTQAAHLYQQAAELGHPNAQYNWAFMLFNGDGIPKNEELATEWYRKSAEQGFMEAQHNLADILRDNGNREEAVIWFRKAAEQGFLESKYELALTLLNKGKGTLQERQEASSLFTELAEQDYKDTQKYVGKLSKKRVQYLYRCRDVFRSFLGR